MASKQKTVVTFAIKMTLPKGGNAASAQQYIRAAIKSHGGGCAPDDPYFGIKEEDFTVAIQKRETTYG